MKKEQTVESPETRDESQQPSTLDPRPSTTLPGGQMVLLEAESDEALLLSPEQRTKLFTAKSANKIGERLDLILFAISLRGTIEETAKRAHCSHHIIRELIAQNAMLIASDMDRYAGWTGGISAAFLAFAIQKAGEDYSKIPMKDFVAAHSFVGKLSLDMKLASNQLKDLALLSEKPMDLETENPALLKAREFLKARAAKVIEAPLEEVKE